MGKRNDIKSIIIVGAGPIVIGQACEFDYSGTQACKALKEEGYRVILVNSNPATIMTDPSMADATYIEPITEEVVEKILEKERPDAILPTMGGQTALNVTLNLHEKGVLDKLNIEIIGAKANVIDKAEDRNKFKKAMTKIGLKTPKSEQINDITKALEALEEIGLPAIIRPSFTLGGKGGGIAYNKEDYINIVKEGLLASPVSSVLIEQSVLGWKEYEMEVVRDKKDNCIIICSIENVDPMGIHTGDSITVAPAMTLTDKEYQIMRNASIAVLREIGVETGGSNVQFAINPENGEMIVIEMNPRVSRSSALASKATGFPIAKVAAKLAVGYTLDELQNDITKTTPASFEPTIDYIVTKIPRFTFEKFEGANSTLTTSMKSVGEVMAIGKSFKQSVQKALRGLETRFDGFNEVKIEGLYKNDGSLSRSSVISALVKNKANKILVVAEAYRLNFSTKDIYNATKIDKWFLEQIKEIVEIENYIKEKGLPKNKDDLSYLKYNGFSDKRLAFLTGKEEEDVRKLRYDLDIHPSFKKIDTCAAEFKSTTPYMYSSYDLSQDSSIDESDVSSKKKVIILGSGPNRIGQGIEFDYCCVHAAYAVSDNGYESIMINCNPETVSTDYDTSDRLYFETLSFEDVYEIVRCEEKKGKLLGVIVQLGGQTPINLVSKLKEAGVKILGTDPIAIDIAEDRELFQDLINRVGVKQSPNGIATNLNEAINICKNIGYPIVIRPSYVLGGRAMEIIDTEEELKRYIKNAVKVSNNRPVLIDLYLKDAKEVDIDVLSDGEEVFVVGVMEHIEEAGIHSGDSACSLPPHTLSTNIIDTIKKQACLIAKELKIVGLMNAQFAVQNGTVYIIEVNPRASRTVPFVAKATNVPIARIATFLMLGKKLSDFDLSNKQIEGTYAVKEAVFPFERFMPEVDVVLGPEMKSTGEVMGIDNSFSKAYFKAQSGSGMTIPESGVAFISVKKGDKQKIVELAKTLESKGFSICCTYGTAKYLKKYVKTIQHINKVADGSPHIVDAIINKEIDIVFNTTKGKKSAIDSMSIRSAALTNNVPYYTTIGASLAALESIKNIKEELNIKPIQKYFKAK